MSAPRFDIAAEIAIETGKWLADNAPPLPTDEIPKSLLKPKRDEPEPSEAMRLIGREVSRETRRYDLREMRRAYNRRDDK